MTPNSIFNDEFDSKSDIFHRGTRATGPAETDSQGLAREQFDETGNALAIDKDGDGEIRQVAPLEADVPADATPEEKLIAARLQNMREIVGLIALGEPNIEKVGLRAVSLCLVLFPMHRRPAAKFYGKGVGTIQEMVNNANRLLTDYLSAET